MLTLAITDFEADPDRVSEILQIGPTNVTRIGDISRSGRSAEFNGWWLEAHGERLVDGAQHAAALTIIIEHLRGKEENFALLRQHVRPESVNVYGGLYLSAEEQSGVWLAPAEMQVLAACGVGWGLDLLVRD
jgi:hypothetical protein